MFVKINQIKKFLKEDKNHAIRVVSGNLKLAKNEKVRKYAFTKKDITNAFGSIDYMIKHLQKKGYNNTTVFLQKMYGTPKKTTYIKKGELKITLNKMNNHYQQPPISIEKETSFMGNPQFLGAMIRSERAGEYRDTINELKDELADLRSENRTLKEERSSLKLQLDTAKERADLQLERDRLDRKGFFESPAFDKTVEALGSVVPAILQMQNQKQEQQSQGLGGVELSLIQKELLAKLQSGAISDEKSGAFLFLNENWQDGFAEEIINLTKKD